jgi:hypothetical protein
MAKKFQPGNTILIVMYSLALRRALKDVREAARAATPATPPRVGKYSHAEPYVKPAKRHTKRRHARLVREAIHGPRRQPKNSANP